MAKGRRHQTHRAERLLGSLAHTGSAAQAVGDPDLDEDDVWSSRAFSAGDDDHGRVPPERGVRDPTRARLWAAAARDHRQVGGLSLAFEDGYDAARPTVVHQYRNVEPSAAGPRGRSGVVAAAASAPVNVPSWPSFLQVDAAEAGALDASAADDDGDDEWLPPHEYLAREHRNSTLATSVFEGVGRTLKGRDMSRVRDAVWSRTGFFG